MKAASMICLMAIMLAAQTAFAEQTIDKNCIAPGAVSLGNIGKDKVNLVQNGSLGPGEQKWFKLDVSETAKLFIKVFNTDDLGQSYSYSSVEFGLVLFDASAKYLASDTRSINMELQPGSYLVRLDARPYEEANYTIIVNNNFETEPNDGMTEANDLGTIADSVILGGSINPNGDADFYKFNLPEGQMGRLAVNGDSDLAFALYSFNESRGYYIPSYTDTYSLYTFIDPGTFYLRVEGTDSYSEFINYTLNISIESVKCDAEPNNSFKDAKMLGALNESAAMIEDGCIKEYGDEDYFKFSVPENMSVTLKTITKGDTKLTLYGSDEEQVAYNDDYEGYSSQIEEELKPGDYYAVVGAYGSGFGYKLSIEAVKK